MILLGNKITFFPNENEEENIIIYHYPKQIKILIEYLRICKEK